MISALDILALYCTVRGCVYLRAVPMTKFPTVYDKVNLKMPYLTLLVITMYCWNCQFSRGECSKIAYWIVCSIYLEFFLENKICVQCS